MKGLLIFFLLVFFFRGQWKGAGAGFLNVFNKKSIFISIYDKKNFTIKNFRILLKKKINVFLLFSLNPAKLEGFFFWILI